MVMNLDQVEVMHKTRQLVHQKEGTPLDGVTWCWDCYGNVVTYVGDWNSMKLREKEHWF